MIYSLYDVVTVPFPFSDKSASKKRPAVVLSIETFNLEVRHLLLAMITTTQGDWLFDLPLSDIKSAGLSRPCKVRLKLFTLDERLVLSKIGHLGVQDQVALQGLLKQFCALG